MIKNNSTTLIGDPTQIQILVKQLAERDVRIESIEQKQISNGGLAQETDLVEGLEQLRALIETIGRAETEVAEYAEATEQDAERRQISDAGQSAALAAAFDGPDPEDAQAQTTSTDAWDDARTVVGAQNTTPQLAPQASPDAPVFAADAAPVDIAALSADAAGGPQTASGDAPASDGGDAGASALGAGGFWGRILSSVERTIDTIDRLTDFIDDYLDRPDIPAHHEQIFKSFLGVLDNILVRLDGLVDLIDKYAPPRFDGWIDHVRDRIAEERDDIEAILNPPAPVEPPIEDDAPVGEDPAEDSPADDEDGDWTAADFTGDGKVVVVIDTGWNTEFLGDDERPVDQRDFYDTDGGGAGSAQVSNSNDHGSWVDQVVRSVADGVETIHLKVFPDGGGGAPMSVIEQALDWVIEQVKADAYDIAAVNLSLGYGNTTAEQSTMLSDEFAELDQLDVFSIVAAGNSGQDGVQVLAADENTIAVSASTSSGGVAGFSQHHEILTDVFAFGQSVRIENETGGADIVSGTSFSAPYVSGVAARLQQAADELIERSLTDDEFIDILQKSGKDLSGYSGDDDPDGYHIADATSALEYFIDHYQDYEVVA